MVQQTRLSHALLLLGSEGSGGLPLALAFAQYLVCEKVNGRSESNQGGPSLFGEVEETKPVLLNDACGACAACTKAAQMVHPDIHFSYPVVPRRPGDKPKSTDYISEWREFAKNSPYGNVYDWLQFIGAENKQGNITAEECNDIIRQLNLKSFESEVKILVMWMPEYMGKEGNKLLKLIEEPPANTIFLLVAEKEELILQTILSRTQLVKVPFLENDEVEEALISRASVSPEKARQVAGLSEGNYREALQLLQHADEDWRELLGNWLGAILRQGQVAQVKWIDDISKIGREKQKQFLRYFTHLLEQSIRLRILGDDFVYLPDKEKDFAARLNKIAGVSQQQAIIEELDKASYYIERNANGKMLFHALTIKLLHIIKNKVLVSG
jgi:DNA polymerase-3 subunit delta'